MSESEHASKAEASAERAGGYLQSAEQYAEDAGETGRPISAALADAYAQMATASATLSLAQRVAAQDNDDQ